MSIKFENTEVMNFEGAIRGMRNPMNSWEKSDSEFAHDVDCGFPGNCSECDDYLSKCDTSHVGENDLALMKRLVNAGSDHRKFMRQILVSVDITAPLYWWKEFDTYKVGTVANSCSTMHKIHEKKFTLDDFSCEHLFPKNPHCLDSMDILDAIIEQLNKSREVYLETKDKDTWWQMIQLLPSSYNQKRTITLNYEVLRNIAHSRRNHKLDEWSIGFMDWIRTLPYSEELIFE